MSTLTLRQAPPERLDFLNINPLALKGLSQGEAERLEVGTTRTGVRLGDCFSVTLDGSDTLTIEATGNPDKLDALLRDLEPYGIKEMVQSGLVAIGRGSRSITTGPALRAA